VTSPRPGGHCRLAAVDLFARSWTALRTAVAELPDEAFAQPSGCAGRLVRDLVRHLVVDAQDVLITLVTPAEAEPTRDALTYWEVADAPPTGDDPLDALTVRLAAAYGEPRLLKFHLDDVGSAAGRAAALADPASGSAPAARSAPRATTCPRTSWSGRCTTSTWSRTSRTRPGRPRRGSPGRGGCWRGVAGAAFPASFSDRDALLVGTGRRAPTAEQTAEVGEVGGRLPFVLG
jgi:hypothetical protein